MDALTEISDAAQAIGNLAVVASLIFLYAQLRIAREQTNDLRIAQREQADALQAQTRSAAAMTQGQNMFEAIKYLELPEHLAARRRVAELKDKPLDQWSADDIMAADIVARIFNIAAVWQKVGVLPHRWLHTYYGNAIARHWDILAPYVADLRQRTDPTQRRDFEEFTGEVRNSAPTLPAPGP